MSGHIIDQLQILRFAVVAMVLVVMVAYETKLMPLGVLIFIAAVISIRITKVSAEVAVLAVAPPVATIVRE